MGIGQVLTDFSGWTSCHGLPHIGSAPTWKYRLFWTLVFLGSLGMFVWQFSMLIDKYLSYSVNTVTTVEYSQLDFPAVTVCNINPFKYPMASIQDPTMLTDPATGLFQNYLDALVGLNTTLATMGFLGMTDAALIQQQALLDLIYISQNNRLPYNAMAYSLSELVLSCVYSAQPCVLNTGVSGDFKLRIDAVYGNCYTFNYKSPAKYQSLRAGNIYGLRMIVKSNQSEYFPHVESGGARVAIHSPSIEFFASSFGYDAAVGLNTMFGIRQTKITRLGKPYGTCTNSADGLTHYYSGDYSVEGCFRSCYQQRAISTCGCGDPRYKLPTGAKFCQLGDTCMAQFSSTKNFSTSFNPTTSCNCPAPCTQVTYAVTVSTSKWPAANFIPLDCQNMSLNAVFYPYSFNSSGCIEWYSNNTAMVEVFYEQTSFQLLAETPAYTLIEFVSDLGGQVGLWFGLSCITIVEFFSFLILLSCYGYQRCKRRMRIRRLAKEQLEKEERERQQRLAEQQAGKRRPVKPYEVGGGTIPPGVTQTFRFAPDLHVPDDNYF